MKIRKKDLIIVLVWPIIAAGLSLVIKANVFVSMILFLAVPSIYLSFINRYVIKKAALFSLLLSIPAGIVVDYFMELKGVWFLPYSIFGSFRLFEYVTLEQIIWLFFYLYFVIIFYETFLEKECACKPFISKIKYLIIIAYALLGLFVIFYLIKPELLNINYFYLKFGAVFVILPILLILLKAPSLYAKLIRAGAYFFYLSFIYEITALELGQWSFPTANQVIGYLTIFGLKFPYEEFIFWIILGGIGTLVYYEFFDDDLI